MLMCFPSVFYGHSLTAIGYVQAWGWGWGLTRVHTRRNHQEGKHTVVKKKNKKTKKTSQPSVGNCFSSSLYFNNVYFSFPSLFSCLTESDLWPVVVAFNGGGRLLFLNYYVSFWPVLRFSWPQLCYLSLGGGSDW